MKPKEFKRLGLVLALAVGACLTFPFNDYTRQDINVSQLSELWFLIGMHLVVCLVFFTLFYFSLTTRWGKLIATISSVFILLQKFPRLLDLSSSWTNSWPLALTSLLITVLVLGAIWLGVRTAEYILERWRPALHHQAFIICMFVCASVILFNTYAFIAYAAKQHQAYAYKPLSSTSKLKLAKNEQRDIYYLVFDRYASQETLQQQFNYDNSPFLNTLRSEGFAVKDDSVANYQYTAPSIASTVRMDYHTDIAKDLKQHTAASYIPYKAILEDSPTRQLLHQAGYDVYNYGNWWNVTRKQKGATNIIPYRLHVVGKTYNLSDLQSNGIQRTFLNNLLQQGLVSGKTNILRLELASPTSLYLGQMEGLHALAKKPSDKPRFVFAHFINPHPPYVFTKDGKNPRYNGDENNVDIPRRDKYVNQMEYANATITQLVATIKSNATKPPIIIIQSDEGPYPLDPVPAWQKASAATLQLKFGTLAAYHLPEATNEEAAQITSPVNIFRFVFNRYFGTQLPYLPSCSYVFNNTDRPYRYYDVTAKLQEPSPECQSIK